jgi:hypothetical protein
MGFCIRRFNAKVHEVFYITSTLRNNNWQNVVRIIIFVLRDQAISITYGGGVHNFDIGKSNFFISQSEQRYFLHTMVEGLS